MPVAPIALGATLLSGVVGAAGSIMTGSAQASAANYNAAVAQNAAKQASSAASAAISQGDVAAQQQYQIGAQRMGGLIAAEGANNINTGTGSALNARVSLADTTARNVAGTQYNANAEAIGYLNQSKGDTAQASLLQDQAGADTTAGYIGAGTSILSAASQVSSKWSYMMPGGTSGPSLADATTATAKILYGDTAAPAIASGGVY